MENANLEKYGFTKTTEDTTETDENGKKSLKKTIFYSVADDCSNMMFWEGVLEQRLPGKLHNSKIISTTEREVKRRTAGRSTKFCKFGVEIHMRNAKKSELTKRSAGQKSARCWIWCCKATIVY